MFTNIILKQSGRKPPEEGKGDAQQSIQPFIITCPRFEPFLIN